MEDEFKLIGTKVRELKMKNGKLPFIINFISKEDRDKIYELLKNVKKLRK